MLTIVAEFEIIGKPEPRAYTDKDNKPALSYKLNVGQNDGTDMATLSTNKEVYDSVRRGDKALFECTVAEYGDKTVFRIMSVKEYLNMPGESSAGRTSSAASASASQAVSGGKK